MKVGDAVSTKKMRVILHENDVISSGYMDFKPNNTNEAFVFLFLGVEKINGERLNPNEVLKQMGWEFKGD